MCKSCLHGTNILVRKPFSRVFSNSFKYSNLKEKEIIPETVSSKCSSENLLIKSCFKCTREHQYRRAAQLKPRSNFI